MNVITEKVGPLPLVVWVAGGAGAVALFIALSHKGNNGAAANQTNSVSALAPTSAEAFGTIEQQQQDVTNALTTLGQNQSALGGSMSTLTGIVTQQGADNAAAFQNLQNGQSQIQQGIAGLGQGQEYWGKLNISETQQAASRLQQYLQNMYGRQQDTASWDQNVLSQLYQWTQYLPWLVGPNSSINSPAASAQQQTILQQMQNYMNNVPVGSGTPAQQAINS
jgi:hypothetical protein